MKQYADFEIWINAAPQEAGCAYQAQVMSSPVGGYISEPLALDLEDEDFKAELKAVSAEDFDEQKRKDFGRLLYDALFHGELKMALAESFGRVDGDDSIEGLRLRLTINPPEVSILPWELLYDPQRDFLALTANRAVSRYLPVPEPPRLQIADRLRILLVAASPQDFDPIPEAQVEELKAAITAQDARFECRLLYNKTTQQIRGELQEGYHVLHFLGHGRPGKLLLTDENGGSDILSEEKFAGLVHGRSAKLRLVILNACGSAQAPGERLFSGIGPSLVQRRIAAVVAMQYDTVGLDTAIAFSESFYQALSGKYPVDVAVNEARSQLRTNGKLETRAWSTPVLYMSTRSGRILQFMGEESQEVRKLRLLAEGSQEAQDALDQIQHSLNDVKTCSDLLRDRIVLERNLRFLQSEADGFAAKVKDLHRRAASLPQWQPNDAHLEILDMYWKRCNVGVEQLDQGLSAGSPLHEEVALLRQAFQELRPAVDEQLAVFLTKETLRKLNDETPKVLDLASGSLNQTRNLIGDQMNELQEITLGLKTRFPEGG